MRKLYLILIMLLAFVSVQAQYPDGNTAFEVEMVGEWNLTLDSISVGGTVGDTIMVNTETFFAGADTISFIFEIMSADSLGTGFTAYPSSAASGTTSSTTFTWAPGPSIVKSNTKTDSIWAQARLQYVSPNGQAMDTTAWVGLTIAFTKGLSSGPVVYGDPIIRTKSVTNGMLWMEICHGYNTRQHVKIRVYAIKRWRR